MNKLIYILLLIVVVVSCKKIDPPIDPSEANDPIYLLEGLMDDDSLKLYVNDTTIFISNSTHNMNGVEAYVSTISDVENNFEFKMIVLRPEIFLDEEGVLLVEKGELDFLVHKTVCKEFNFSNGSNQSDYLSVNIDDVNSEGGVADVEEYGKYVAQLKFSNINSQTYNIPIEVGFQDEILNPDIEIEGIDSGIHFTALNSDLSHKLWIDNELVSELTEGDFILSHGIHVVTHTIEDGYGNVASYSTLVMLQNDQFKWSMDYSYCSTDMVKNNYGNVIIEVIHNGEKYKSDYNLTNLNNNLVISNIVYMVNVNTQSIDFVKFNIRFDAELKTEDNLKTMNLKNMKGIFHIEVN